MSAALVLISSGWGPALSRMLGSRPSWSVCGQTLCMCQPLPLTPDCPLCPPADASETPCPTVPVVPAEQEGRIDPSRIALVNNAPGVVFSQVGHAAEGLLIGLFLLGTGPDRGAAIVPAPVVAAPLGWSLPGSPDRAVATPPPRIA